MAQSSKDYQALHKAVVGEAIGESREGQEAVAAVIRNRVNDPRWPDNIHDVVHQSHQFECVTNSNLSNLMKLPEAQEIHEWLPNTTSDPVNGANHYYAHKGDYAAKETPDWAVGKTPVAEKGNHIFYRL